MSTLLSPAFLAQFDWAFYELTAKVVRSASVCCSKSKRSEPMPEFVGPTYVASINVLFMAYEEIELEFADPFMGSEQPTAKTYQARTHSVPVTMGLSGARATVGYTFWEALGFASSCGTPIDLDRGDYITRIELIDNLGNVVDVLSSCDNWGCGMQLETIGSAGDRIVRNLIQEAKAAASCAEAKRLRYTASLMRSKLSAHRHSARLVP